jgi:hypothetical protein
MPVEAGMNGDPAERPEGVVEHPNWPDHDRHKEMSIMANLNVVPLQTPRKHRAKAPRTVAEPRPSSTRRRLATASASAIGLVAVAATALSLSDLADSIMEVAHVTTWKAYALATALDANFISTEAFSLFATAAVSKATHRATTATKVITLAMSGIANAYAMAHTADGTIMQSACIVAGFAIPGLVALATFTLGKAVRA